MRLLEYFKGQKEDNNFNLLPDAVFTLAQDAKIIDVNDKLLEIYSISRFDILGRYFSDFVEDGIAILNKIVSEGNLACARAIMRNKLKPPLLELSVAKNIETSKVYVIARDTTLQQAEQKTVNEKYRIAQKIIDGKNDFLLESSGAILSNLVSISGFSRALLDGIAGALSDKQEKYLTLINQNARDINYDLEKLFTLFKLESKKVKYDCKLFDLINTIKSINRIYKKEFEDRKIIFSLDYSNLAQRDCYLDSEVIEYIIRTIMDIFSRFSNLGKCTLNIGHPPLDFLKSREFAANDFNNPDNFVLFEAKITDLVFSEDELENIFDTYYKSSQKRPIGLKASLNILKFYINDFGGDIWVYSKQGFGTMITFVLPLK